MYLGKRIFNGICHLFSAISYMKKKVLWELVTYLFQIYSFFFLHLEILQFTIDVNTHKGNIDELMVRLYYIRRGAIFLLNMKSQLNLKLI